MHELCTHRFSGLCQDMGKVEAGKLELEHRAFKLEDVVADARIFCIAAEKKGLGFEEDIDRVFEGQVLGDMPRLRQVLANVLSNAIKVSLAFVQIVLIYLDTDSQFSDSSRKRARSRSDCIRRARRDERSVCVSKSRTPALASRRTRSRTCSSRSTKRTLPLLANTAARVLACALLAMYVERAASLRAAPIC